MRFVDPDSPATPIPNFEIALIGERGDTTRVITNAIGVSSLALPAGRYRAVHRSGQTSNTKSTRGTFRSRSAWAWAGRPHAAQREGDRASAVTTPNPRCGSMAPDLVHLKWRSARSLHAGNADCEHVASAFGIAACRGVASGSRWSRHPPYLPRRPAAAGAA